MTAEPTVPLASPAIDAAAQRDLILAGVARVIDGGAYILGPEVAAFERAMAARLGTPDAVGVGSGTDALVLAMTALGVGAGDEVVTVSHTAGATVAAILLAGARPVLVDIEADTYGLDPARLEAAIGPKTKAVIAVHLYGHPAALTRIQEIAGARGIPVIEDCAQAQEATIGGRAVGSLGDAGCFSFYPTKNLGAIGDGGLITARRPETIERLRHLRTYGWKTPQYAEIAGGRCSRLDELQAAILSVRLTVLDAAIARRREIADRYRTAFADLPLTLPVEKPGCRHVYHLYVVRTGRRADLAAHLRARGVASGLHYPHPAHVQPAFAAARIPEPLTVTEAVAPEILTLPLFPGLTGAQQDRVIEAVTGFFRHG